MSAQGSSSMSAKKKNIALDFYDSEVGGYAFAIKFGDWVAQDSYHLKAFYYDFIKGSSIVAYKLAKEIEDNYPSYKNRIWKRALLDIEKIAPYQTSDNQIADLTLQGDTGAMCMPQSFPVVVYQNGNFYGIFAWCIKKHRDNYHMDSKSTENIHLDGTLNDSFFHGTISWNSFEIRNPKNLCYQTAVNDSYKYDADIALSEIAGTDNNYDGEWVDSSSYAVGRIVTHNENFFINTISDNTKEPVTKFGDNKNTASSPDFNNKTGCGWINCTNSVIVKQHIKDFLAHLKSIQDATIDTKKELINKYLDKENLIDYMVLNSSVNDVDGFAKNWQWLTYDGTKWFVSEYDKDQSFGNDFRGIFTRKPITNGYWLGYNV